MTTFQSIINVNQPVLTAPSLALPVRSFSAPVPVSRELHQQQGDGTKNWKVSPQGGMPWSLVKELGIIKMTPYAKGNVKVENYTAKLPHHSAAFDIRWNSKDYPKDGQLLPAWNSGYYIAESTWDEQLNLVSASLAYPSYSLQPYDYSKELNKAKAAAVEKSMNGFDLLTNMAELPETLGMILGFLKAARHPLEGAKELFERYKKDQRTLRNGRDPNKLKKLKELDKDFRNQWLQYRYGIMPLILSIKDAIELLDKAIFKYHTEKSGDVIDVSGTSKPTNINVGSYIYQNRSGSIKISTVGKAKYSNANNRLSDLITVNPFLTAWELIPLSFVIDWFVNVGDVIFSNTSALMDISEQRSFCYSVKKEITTQTLLYSSYEENIRLQNASPSEGVPSLDIELPLSHRSIQKLRVETEVSYERFLFQPSDIDFEFFPSLGWMRQLDAYALSFSSISKLLKKLR